MDVTEIHIKRFKSLKDLKLLTKRITVLTGPNNAGKSSVLQAIQFATSIAQSAKTYSPDSTKGTLAAEQLLYSPLRDVAALAPDMRFTQSEANAIAITVKAELVPGVVEVCEVSVRRGKNANVSYKVTDIALGKKMAEITNPFSVFVTGLAGIPRQEEWKSEGVIRKAAARGDANSVLRNVLWLLNRDPVAWDRFKADIDTVFPGLDLAVTFNPNIDELIAVTFAAGPARLPIDAVGTGVLQAIQILSYVNVYQPALLLLDEPDSHLHPNNQRALATLLVRLANERDFQVVLTTHSRHFIDELRGQAETFWFANGQIATDKFDLVQALVDLGALDSIDIFAAKDFVILTEDTDMRPITAVIEAAGIDPNTAAFRSFSGCSNIASTFPVADFIRNHAPNVKVLVHRDRDYELDADVDSIRAALDDAGLVTFIPNGVDIENCFLDAHHINELYPEVSVGEAQLLLDAATTASASASSDMIGQGRVLQAAKKTQGGLNKLDISGTVHQASAEYQADPIRFRLGKLVLGNLKQELQRVVGRHVDLFRNSAALRARPEVLQIQAALATQD